MHIINLLAIGFGLGVRHAIEPDHVAAVSTFSARTHSYKKSVLTGLLWGLGHTVALLVAGFFVLWFQIPFPERLSAYLELGVGVMLLSLGIMTIRIHGERHSHTHTHDGTTHQHVHYHGVEPRGLTLSFLVGIVHGLAGTGSFMLVVLAGVRDIGMGILYILIFGLGSIGAMGLMSAIISIPAVTASESHTKLEMYFRKASGLVSILLGLYIIYEVGFINGTLISLPK